MQEEKENLMEETEEVYRLRKFEEGKRQLKIKISIPSTAVLSRSWTLSGTEEYKRVCIRRDKNEERTNM